MTPDDKTKKRTLPIWTNYAVLLVVVFLPLAYKANNITNEITETVLWIVGLLSVSSDAIGFVHRKLTEKLKLQEASSVEAPK